MTLQEFKSAFNVQKLSFYKSKSTDRYVASFGANQLLITTEDFDKAKPGYVYDNPAGDGSSMILSNKQPREAEFTL